MKKSLQIQTEFSKICAQLGDLIYKVEHLKQVQIKLNQDYQNALEEEKTPDSTKN